MKFQKLDLKKHSSLKVAELLYETDHTLLNFFYGKKSRAVKILEKLIIHGKNNLGPEHICVATENEALMGILLYYKGGHHRFGELKFHFKNLKLKDAIIFLLMDIKDIFILSHLEKSDFYMAGVAVDEEHRGKGVGTFILNMGINLARKKGFKRVVLDVALDNHGAKRLYLKTGFKVFDKRSYPWFNGRIGMYNMDYPIK